MGRFLKDYILLFKDSSIGDKINLLLAALMVPLFLFVGIDYFIEFLNREPQPPKPIPLSDSELFQKCIDSIKDYEDPRFDSAVEGCTEAFLYNE
jgi:hypothetical protein